MPKTKDDEDTRVPNIVMTTSYLPFDVQITSNGETSTVAAQYLPTRGVYSFGQALPSDAEWAVLLQEEAAG